MSKIGVHIVMGARTGYGAFLQRIAIAGRAPALIKCVDDFGGAEEAKTLFGSKVITVGRVNNGPGGKDLQALEPYKPDGSPLDPKEAAKYYYGLVVKTWTLNRKRIDVWETFNEYSAHWDWQGNFYMALMDLAEADGFKLALYACSTGNPNNVATVMQMLPVLRAAKKRGHYLALHEYGNVGTNIITLKGTEPYHALRYRQLYESILIPNEADPPLLITECGQNGGSTFPGLTVFMNDIEWYDSELCRDPYVLGAALFTLGNWAGANFKSALPTLADYIASGQPAPRPHEPLAPPYVFGKPPILEKPPVTPPPAGKPRGTPRLQYNRVYFLLPNEPPTLDGNLRASRWVQALTNSGILTRYRLTLGFSADDAAVGDLDQRHVVAINPETWPGSLADFYAQNYPGINFKPIRAASPEDLQKILVNLSGFA